MYKKILALSLITISFIFFTGCSQSVVTLNDTTESGYNDSYSYNLLALDDETTPERKIIYKADVSFDVRNLEESSDTLIGLMNSDEWFDEVVMNSTYHYYVIRIKTDRLDDFIESLKDEFTLRSYQLVGTDISLQYQDASNRILSLEAQLARLIELYDQATLSEMIIINEQISDIEVELQELEGTLSQFDSLAEYSEVVLKFYGSSVVSESPFFNRLGNAFLDGWNGLISFFEGFFIVIATIFPFALLIGSIVIVVLVSYRKKIKQKKALKEVASALSEKQ